MPFPLRGISPALPPAESVLLTSSPTDRAALWEGNAKEASPGPVCLSKAKTFNVNYCIDATFVDLGQLILHFNLLSD